MKKSKILAAVVAAAVLSVSGGVLAGCNNEHKHTYSDDWTKDETGHWHVATCDDLKEGDKDYKSGFAAHVWGDDDECDICHYTRTPPAPVSKVTLNKSELTLGIGNLEAELTATVEGGGTVTWASDNPTVVAVNEETGYVEAFKPGAATITATMVGGAAADKATCEVVVADGYYLIGGQDSAWNKVGVFGQSGVIYFMPTATEGIYKTESTELPKLGNFQVALVGDTSGDWYKKAFNGDYIATGDTVLSKNGGGNIEVEKHGKYTITLDLTGDKAVVSGVCDQVIDDGDEKDVYYIVGSANTTSGWTTVTDAAAAGDYVFTDNGDDTYTLTVELTKGTEFKVAIAGMAWNGALGESAIPRDLIGVTGSATVDTDYKLTFTSSDNIGVGLSGKYIFTLNPKGGNNDKLSYTFEATDDTETGDEVTVLHYYIKGKTVTNWQSPVTSDYELTETAADSGIYSITIELTAGDEFMFWSSAEGKDGTVTGIQADYFNKGNSTFTADGDCVTAPSSNFIAGAAGWYTITLNPTTKALTFSYSATEPQA